MKKLIMMLLGKCPRCYWYHFKWKLCLRCTTNKPCKFMINADGKKIENNYCQK